MADVPSELQVIVAGDDFALTLGMQDETGAPQDITGATSAQFNLHRWRGSPAPEVALSYTLGDGIELTAPGLGELTITMGAETEALVDGTYWTDCWLTMVNGKRRSAAPFLLRVLQTPRE